MGIHFFESDQELQSRDNVRIEEVTITPYPDRFRVHVKIRVTPFRERPNLVIVARDERDRIVSELDVIATMHSTMEFTIHLRDVDDPAGTYSLTVDLFYESKHPPHDRRVEGFVIPDIDGRSVDTHNEP